MSSLKFVKTEVFDPSVMKALLCHSGLTFDTKQQLKKYHKKRYNGNQVDTVYDYSKAYHSSKVGRVYAVGSIGLQGFERDVRNALSRSLYFDVDIENAHSAILLKVCQSKGWVCPMLQNYVEKREEVLSNIMNHYGASRKDAKNLMIRMMFLGHPESWVGETICENSTKPMEYVTQYKIELNNIAENVWRSYPDIVDIVNKKRKVSTTQKLSSCLSLMLQTEEHKILMAIDESLKAQGRSMDVFIFDGGLVRKLASETQLPTDILRACERFVMDTLGYKIQLAVKPIETSLILSTQDEARLVDPNVVVDDVYAAKTFTRLMGDNIVYTDKALYVFNDSQGLWTDDDVAIRQCVNKFEDELKFEQLDTETGKIRLFNYSGNEKNINNMLKNVPPFCVCEDFFGKYADTSRGKLLYADGIYDYATDTFTKGFNPKIVFKDRIERPYPILRDNEMIQHVHTSLFEDTFMDEDKAASKYLRIGLARAMFGDFNSKLFYFCVGRSNAGKGVLTDALKAAFGGFVGTFNAGALAHNDKNGADCAKQLSWVFGVKDKRMVISNEVSMNRAFDGNLVKMLASGGDEFDARKNHKDEVKVINRSTLFCFVNDIPTINPYDDGVGNRVRCIEYKCVFTDDEITKDFERVADKDIKDKFKHNVDYQNALIHIIEDSYKEFKAEGHKVPECIREATKEWSGDSGSVEGLLSKRYDITRDANDFVPARELIDFLTKEEKLTMSDKKIGMELSALKLEKGGKTTRGKTIKVWYGLKARDDGYYINDNEAY